MRFRLTRTYSIASLVGIAIIATVLGLFYRAMAVKTLIDYETQSNVALTQGHLYARAASPEQFAKQLETAFTEPRHKGGAPQKRKGSASSAR